MTLTSRLRVGLRREVLILFPVAFLLLIVLCAFVLLSYRTAIDLFLRQRQDDAAQAAARVASSLPHDRRPGQADLRRLSIGSVRAALVRPNGTMVAVVGDFDRPILEPVGDRRDFSIPVGLGPDDSIPDLVAGFATSRRDGSQYIVRVDLGAAELAFQARAIRVLFWVVLGTSVGVAVLVFLYSRHLLRPYEALLAQARRIGGTTEGDEITFLTETIEDALTQLVETADRPDADIEAIQRALGPSMESGFLLLDREAAVMSINTYGARILGAESSDDLAAVERHLAEGETLREVVRGAIAKGGHVQRREVDVEIDGRRRTLGVTMHPLRRDDGEARAYLALFADLTEAQRIEREEKLNENLTQLGEMAAGVAHEIRNSLATVRGYLTLIERRPEEESLVDYVEEMRRESDHLQRVVDDFLAFTRPETKRVEDVDVAEIARRVAHDPAIPESAAMFEEPESDLPTIRGDAQLLERALRNLVHNAVQAHDSSGVETPVRIRTEVVRDELVVAVTDDGGGVPEAVRGRLFQPFVTGRADGVGLGLTLARRIVGLHGGKLSLDDRPGGTVARIAFPAPSRRRPDKIG